MRRRCGSRAGGFTSLVDPRFNLKEIPHDAAGCEVETSREFAALLHFANGAVCKGHDGAQLLATYHAPNAGTFVSSGRRHRNPQVVLTQ